MGMTMNGLSYWQAESEGINLLDTTIGDLFTAESRNLEPVIKLKEEG